MSNAVKFTRHGAVDVVACLKPSEGGHMLCVDVIDSGVGIAEENLKNIFDPFVQADNCVAREFGDINRKFISTILTEAGLRVSTTENGQLGVELTTRDQFELILYRCDLRVSRSGKVATDHLQVDGRVRHFEFHPVDPPSSIGQGAPAADSLMLRRLSRQFGSPCNRQTRERPFPARAAAAAATTALRALAPPPFT